MVSGNLHAVPGASDDSDRPLDRVLDFLQDHGEQYASLCMHAAVPLGLTADLLHLIRYNFLRSVPSIAEADILLSPLCHDAGGGFYQLRSSVRDLLIFELDSDDEYGRRRIEQICELLLAYVQLKWRTSHDKEMRSFLLAQKWTALAYLDPAEAARQLAAALSSEIQGFSDSDLVRIASITKHLSAPLQSEESLLHYAAGIEKMAIGSMAAAARFFKALGNTKSPLSVQGVPLPAPDELLRSAQQKHERRDEIKTEKIEDESAARWPSAAEYREALEQFGSDILPAELAGARVLLNNMGLPVAVAGTFSSVYQLQMPNGSIRALKVFSFGAPELAERYEQIARYLEQLKNKNNGPLVPVNFVRDGIRLGTRYYPIVIMPWISGTPLDVYIADCCASENAQAHLADLRRQWHELLAFLRQSHFAHGDLQPSNILVTPDGKLRLIDYDGMCVPNLVGLRALEMGTLPYQHPGRNESTALNLELDNFAAILIDVSLTILTQQPALRQQVDTENLLLFRPDDLRFPESSRLIQAILQLDDQYLRAQLHWLLRIWQGRFADCCSLEEFEQRAVSEDWATKKAFLSYSHRDQLAVQEIATVLEIREHVRLIDPVRELEERWKEEMIRQQIQDTELFILFWSRAAADSDFVRHEWQSALSLGRSDFLQIYSVDENSPPLPPELSHIPIASAPSKEVRPLAWSARPPDVNATRRYAEVYLSEAAFLLDMPNEQLARLLGDESLASSPWTLVELSKISDLQRQAGESMSWAYIACDPRWLHLVREVLTPILNNLGVRRVYDSGWLQNADSERMLTVLDYADLFLSVIDANHLASDWAKAEWTYFRDYSADKTRIALFIDDTQADSQNQWLNTIPTIAGANHDAALAGKLRDIIGPVLATRAVERVRGVLSRSVSPQLVATPVMQAVHQLTALQQVEVTGETTEHAGTVDLSLEQIRLRTALRLALHPHGLTYQVHRRGIEITKLEPRRENDPGPKAIISDIFSNLDALDAVLEDIDRYNIRQIYCLGNVFGPGAYPCECCDIALGFQCNLLGDFDQALLFDPDDFEPQLEQAAYWSRQQMESRAPLGERRWNSIGDAPRMHREHEVLYCNATPRNPTREMLLPEDIYNPRKMERIFEAFERVCFVGHTGVPGVFRQSGTFVSPEECSHRWSLESEKIIVNVGSVGWPRDGDWRASYVIFDQDRIHFRRVEYDVQYAVAKMRSIAELAPFAEPVRSGREKS